MNNQVVGTQAPQQVGVGGAQMHTRIRVQCAAQMARSKGGIRARIQQYGALKSG